MFSCLSRVVVLSLFTVSLWAHEGVWSISPGVLGASGIDASFVANAALFIAMLILWVVCIAQLLKLLFNLPIIAGQIIAGLLLGPSCINIARWPLFFTPLRLFDHASGHTYQVVSSDLLIFCLVLFSSIFTISYLMWIAGHETDIEDILKVGWAATLAGLFGAVLPIVMTALVMYYGFPDEEITQALGLGLIFSATSVSIPVAMLFSYNKMHLKSSKATLGAAIIDDILAVVLLSLFLILLQSGTFGEIAGLVVESAHQITIGEALIWMIGSFVLLLLIGYFGIPAIVKMLKKYHYSHLLVPVATGIMLLYFAFAEKIGGLAGITGAYFAGLFHRMGDKRHRAEKVISPFVNFVLLPLFLGLIGFSVDLKVLSGHQWLIVAVLLIVSIVSKLLGCYLAAGASNLIGERSGKWSFIEAYLFGSSMVARGEVGLVIATILYSWRVLSTEYYTIALVVIVLTTIASPIMLGIGFAYLTRTEEGEGYEEYTLNIGLFNVIGTLRLFDIIGGRIEANNRFNTSIRISEGRKIINIEGLNIQIILCPERGILFRGDRDNIGELLHEVQEAIHHEVDRIVMHPE
ncbi:cation:proton antiporter [Candidatus Dependentiae bacterium]|nr:cation:proton antiporter [Candidatus Dependentiae bacterium]